jgi:ribosomal protein S13
MNILNILGVDRKMKKNIQNALKKSLGIRRSDNPKKVCKKCLYHDHQKICQIHLLKTRVDEVCDRFTPSRKHVIFLGGGFSPK